MDNIQNKIIEKTTIGLTEIKGVDEDNFTVDAVLSDDNIDRDNEVILPSAFEKRLPEFMKRPILVSSHAHSDLRKQIGAIDKINILKNRVDMVPRYFVGKGNPEADWGFELAKEHAAAYSHRFIPFEVVFGDNIQNDPDIPQKIKKAKPDRV